MKLIVCVKISYLKKRIFCHLNERFKEGYNELFPTVLIES